MVDQEEMVVMIIATIKAKIEHQLKESQTQRDVSNCSLPETILLKNSSYICSNGGQFFCQVIWIIYIY